jgi:heat-inducible transcriptional repressor
MVVMVLSNGAVENETMELDDDVPEARLTVAGAHLSRSLGGRALHEVGEVPTSGDSQVDELCAAALDAISGKLAAEPVYVGGASAMAQAFDAVEVVRRVLATLEQQYVVVTLVRDVLDRGLTVAIGGEHGVEPLAACSVVVAPVLVEGEPLGTIGVLGPTRMNYPQALAAVEVVSDRLGRRLADN